MGKHSGACNLVSPRPRYVWPAGGSRDWVQSGHGAALEQALFDWLRVRMGAKLIGRLTGDTIAPLFLQDPACVEELKVTWATFGLSLIGVGF